LRSPAANPLSSDLTEAIRSIPDFLPEAATTSEKLALASLTNTYNNVLCLYHTKKDRRGGSVNGAADKAGHFFHGVPGIRMLAKSKARWTKPQAGLLHCGCSKEDVLLDFYWYKTWSVTFTADDVEMTEGMGYEYLHPWDRGFVIEYFKSITGLTISDLYCSSRISEKAHKIMVVKKSIEFLMKQLNELSGGDGDDNSYKVEPPLFPLRAPIKFGNGYDTDPEKETVQENTQTDD